MADRINTFSRSRPDRDSYRWAPFTVSGIALLLGLAATWHLARTTQAKARERFDIAAQQVSDAIQDLLNGLFFSLPNTSHALHPNQ